MSFDELENINKEKIKTLKDEVNINPDNDSAKKQLHINEKIEKLFKEEGQKLFFKIKMEDSIKILEQIIDREIAEKVYLEFISPDAYSELLDAFKI